MKRCWLALLLTLVACQSGCGGSDRDQLNVLLVTLDTTRADYLGCYGSSTASTPTLDALAAAGVRFDLAISPSANTPSSHASLLTGLNPYQHELRVIYADGGCHLDSDVPSLPTILQTEGWSTAAFLSSFTVSEFYGFDNGFDLFDNGLDVPADRSFQRATTGIWDWPLRSNQRRADETTARALGWLEQVKPPFFAWVHYWDPHDTAILPPDAYLQRFLQPGQDEAERRRATYAAEVAFVDAQFERVLSKLRERGFDDRTIVIVVADHGEGLGDHDWWFHRILYQEQIRVPLILRAPGWPAGATVGDLVRTTDVLPTVLDLLGIETPPGIEGRSVKEVVFGEPEAPRIAYADAINLYDLNAKLLNRRPDDGLVYCAMDREWKLIHRPNLDGKDELYHLADDPEEGVNMVTRHPEEVDRLLTWLRARDGFVTGPFGEAVDPAVLKRLRALGYIGD